MLFQPISVDVRLKWFQCFMSHVVTSWKNADLSCVVKLQLLHGADCVWPIDISLLLLLSLLYPWCVCLMVWPECSWRQSQTHDARELSRIDLCLRYVTPRLVRICPQSPPVSNMHRLMQLTHDIIYCRINSYIIGLSYYRLWSRRTVH